MTRVTWTRQAAEDIEAIKAFVARDSECHAGFVGVAPRRINEIVHGKRSITADTALRLSGVLERDVSVYRAAM